MIHRARDLAVALLPLLAISLHAADAEPPLPAGAFARLGTARLRHAPIIASLAFTPDDKLVLSASFHGTLRFWDPATGKQTRLLENIGGRFSLSHDGKTLACTYYDGRIVLRQADTGQQTALLKGHAGEVVWAAFSKDDKKLVSAGSDRTVRLWDLTTLSEAWSGSHSAEVRCAAISDDGKHVASTCQNGNAALWEAATGRKLHDLKGHTSRATCVAFAPGSKTLVTGSWDSTARLWDVASGKQTRLVKDASGLENVAFSPDGKSLATIAGGNHQVTVWDLTAAKDTPRWRGRHWHGLRLAYSHDGKVLASAGWDCVVRLWDAATGKRLPADLPADGHEGWVYAIKALPDGKGVLTACSDNQVLLWDLAGRRVLRRFEGHTSRVWCLALSPDGRTLASGSADQTIRLWDVESGRQRRKIDVRGQVKGLAFSPDGSRLASAIGLDSSSTWLPAVPGSGAQIWEVETGESKVTLAGQDGGVKSVAFSPDGRTVATAGNDGTVRLYDAATGKEQLKLTGGGTDPVEAVAFSPDGEVVAATGKAQKVWLWQARTGERLFELQGPKGWGLSLAFSPDGRTLASAASEDVIYQAGGRAKAFPVRLWEVATGKERARYEGHQGTAQSVEFLADGTGLISGGADGAPLLWDLSGRRVGVKPTPAQAAWADLLGEDGAAVQRAVWSLAAQPKQALPLLRGALKRVPKADPARIAKLIHDLDDDSYPVREKATRALAAMGEAASKALREAAVKGPSAEVRDRAEQLLAKFSVRGVSGEALRQLRAMEVLEHADSPDLLALLKELAGGAPEAGRTQQAKAALQRQKRRKG